METEIKKLTESDYEMLNFIYKNAEMGVSSLNQLKNVVKDERLKKLIDIQYEEYKEIYDKAESYMKAFDRESDGISLLQKLESYIMINLKTMNDEKSLNNIAEMLIQGSTMGEIQILRNLRKYKDKVDENIYSLGEKLLKTEQYNIKECKKLLS